MRPPLPATLREWNGLWPLNTGGGHPPQKQKAAVLHRDLWCRAQPRHLESFTLHSPWPPARQTWLSSHLPSHKFIFVFLTWGGGSFTKTLSFLYAYLDPTGSDGKASACNVGDRGSSPGSGRSPGEGNGSPLQHSCLENPMDGGAWQATVYGVAKSQTGLSDFTSLHYTSECSRSPVPCRKSF